MQGTTKTIPLWFIAAFVPMVASQVIRLHQTLPLDWLLCDYAGRLGALLVLAAIPAARAVAFRRQPLLTSWWETVLWIIGLVLVYPPLGHGLSALVNAYIPNTPLGPYPAPQGGLYLLDLTFGLVLVAYHEEVIFRRCARAVFSSGWGEGAAMIGLSALLFSAYHWTTGLGNMVYVFFFAIYAMFFLRRVGALWPLILAHFLVDFVQFL